jgi:hypothetical protein
MLQQADNAAAMLPEVKSLYVHLHYSPPFISPGWEVLMFKVLEQIDGNLVERDSPAVFCREATSDGGKRLRVSLPREKPFLLFKLVEGLRPPFQLLYVLRTPRGEGEAGRYQSPPLSRTQTQDFLRRFEAFFLADARYDLWVRSASSGDVIDWDRHNDLYVYGGLVDIADRLMQLGFQEGLPPSIGPHQHHYRREFDCEAAEVLSSF